MVEMTWNVNQPGRWRRPDVVPLLKEEDTDWKRYSLGRNMGAFDARKYLEFRLFWPFSSGIPDQWLVHQIDTVHWFTGLPHPRSCVANGGIYLWKDGRTNWDTMTAVFDYGPLDDLTKGFQVQYSSRFTNSAGGVKELYYSNGGMIDMDKQTVTPTGGLTKRFADEMHMQPNLLPSICLLYTSFFRLQRLSQLRARGLSRQRICRHLHGFRTAVHYQRHVQIGAGRIGAHRCLATVNRKIRHSHLDLVGVCGGNDELKAALPIGLLSERCGVGWVGLAQRDLSAGNDAAGCVVHHTGDAKASRRLRPQPKREDRET